METSPKDNLTKNERRVVAETMTGKTKTQAAAIAYPKSNNPKQMGHKVLARPRVQKALRDYLEEAGITPDKRAAEYKRLAFDSEFGDNVPNDPIRLKALDQIDDLIGDKAPERHIHANLSESLTEKLFTDLDNGHI